MLLIFNVIGVVYWQQSMTFWNFIDLNRCKTTVHVLSLYRRFRENKSTETALSYVYLTYILRYVLSWRLLWITHCYYLRWVRYWVQKKIKSNIDKYTREEHPTSSINKKRRATSILYRTDVKLEFAGRLCATNVGHCKPCQRELYREWAFRFGYVRYFLYICRLNEIP